ncbi:MAG: hypothetical protein RIQ81_1701 [Pseudomonadota bacterium]|jgi:hypothetical protein
MPTYDKPYLPAEFLVRHGAKGTVAIHDDLPRLTVTGLEGLLWGIKINGFRVLDLGPVASAKVFESSGTSAQGRSKSRFSDGGLAAYREAIASGFFSALERLGDLPEGAGQKLPGISLVPPPQEWPTSSLAAMVHWLGEKTQVAYCRPEEDAGLALAMKVLGERPLWVFGTAFHLIPLLDRGRLPRLPKGSFVIFTGGTKGKTRDVSEAWLVEALARGFGIPEKSVISEYGMSELASAAYTAFSGDERRLTFQRGAIPFVVNNVRRDAGGLCYEGGLTGTGLLGIVDLNRIDLPAPVITEDVVTIYNNGTFSLLGRARMAPLKGCSLMAEEVRAKIVAPPQPQSHLEYHTLTRRPVRIRSHGIVGALVSFLESPEAIESLSREIGSTRAAQLALEDALGGLKTLTPDILAAAVHRSGALDISRHASVQGQPPRLLLIPPNTHPMALPMPLTLALAAGLEPTVRLPKGQERQDSFTRRLLRRLATAGWQIDTVDSSFRIGAEGLPGFAALLVFGDDQTVEEIRRAAGPSLHVAGHGGALTASIVTWAELPDLMDQILADTCALMQDGCMASRMLGIVVPQGTGKSEVEQVCARLMETSWWRFWREALSPLHASGLLSRGLATPAPGIAALSVHDGPVPAAFGPQLSVGLVTAGSHPSAAASEAVSGWLEQWPMLRLVTASTNLLHDIEAGFGTKIDVRPIGRANRPVWNGLHFGRPVFSGSC